MKYIVWRTTVAGARRDLPVLFPDELVHKDVAESLRCLLYDLTDGEPEVVAAGFARVDSVVCTGKSETLDKASRGSADKKLIESFDLMHGWVES